MKEQLKLLKKAHVFAILKNFIFVKEGDLPKIDERGYWFILEIQRALPLTQTLLEYFDQNSYRE